MINFFFLSVLLLNIDYQTIPTLRLALLDTFSSDNHSFCFSNVTDQRLGCTNIKHLIENYDVLGATLSASFRTCDSTLLTCLLGV